MSNALFPSTKRTKKCEAPILRACALNTLHLMNLREIDWRIEPLDHVIVGIDAGLAAIDERLDTVEWFGGDDTRWHAEFGTILVRPNPDGAADGSPSVMFTMSIP